MLDPAISRPWPPGWAVLGNPGQSSLLITTGDTLMNLPPTAGFTLPGNENVTYNRFLPNLGLSYSPFGPAHQFYASFAETLSAPTGS